MALVVVTPLPEREEPVSPPSAVLSCEGGCRSRTTQVKFTRHIFIRADIVPRGQAQIYACLTCGAERRYGLVGTGVDADIDD